MALKKLPDFTNQLTKWLRSKKECKSVTKQLYRHGLKYGEDFEIRTDGKNRCAVFVNYKATEDNPFKGSRVYRERVKEGDKNGKT